LLPHSTRPADSLNPEDQHCSVVPKWSWTLYSGLTQEILSHLKNYRPCMTLGTEHGLLEDSSREQLPIRARAPALLHGSHLVESSESVLQPIIIIARFLGLIECLKRSAFQALARNFGLGTDSSRDNRSAWPTHVLRGSARNIALTAMILKSWQRHVHDTA
jgi:hypothetical protein